MSIIGRSIRVLSFERPTGEKTISGALLAFSDAVAGVNYIDLAAAIVPVQSGSGDPSTSNVRPIAGYNGARFYQSGEDTSDPAIKTVTWLTEAGTVYGGGIDLTTGVLTVDRFGMVVDGVNVKCASAGAFSSGARYSRVSLNTAGRPKGVNSVAATYADTLISDKLRSWYSGKRDGTEVDTGVGGCNIAGNGVQLNLILPDQTITTKEDADLWLQSNNVQVVYKMADAVTYQLTGQQLAAISGVNKVWADCGDVTLTYEAYL